MRLRGVSYIVSAVAFTIIALMAAYGVYTWIQGNVSAHTHGNLEVTVKPVVSDNGVDLVITFRNAGGSTITVQSVTLDGSTNLSTALGLPLTIEPGGKVSKRVSVGTISGGAHTISVVYVEGGENQEDEWSFTV